MGLLLFQSRVTVPLEASKILWFLRKTLLLVTTIECNTEQISRGSSRSMWLPTKTRFLHWGNGTRTTISMQEAKITFLKVDEDVRSVEAGSSWSPGGEPVKRCVASLRLYPDWKLHVKFSTGSVRIRTSYWTTSKWVMWRHGGSGTGSISKTHHPPPWTTDAANGGDCPLSRQSSRIRP